MKDWIDTGSPYGKSLMFHNSAQSGHFSSGHPISSGDGNNTPEGAMITVRTSTIGDLTGFWKVYVPLFSLILPDSRVNSVLNLTETRLKPVGRPARVLFPVILPVSHLFPALCHTALCAGFNPGLRRGLSGFYRF